MNRSSPSSPTQFGGHKVACLILAVLALAHAAQAIYIDYCGGNEFEKVYRRSALMVMDFRNPEVHQDITRYKRDFGGQTKWEKDTFLVWRFPNGETNDKVFLVVNEMKPEASTPNQNNLIYSWSTDDKTWNTVPADSVKAVTDKLNDSYTRRNVTISLPQPARYFQIYWPPCEWDAANQKTACVNYYSPSISHFCAASSQRNEDANLGSCYPRGRYDPPMVDPTVKYCGTKMVNNFWNFQLFGSSKNLLGGYSASDGTMARAGHHYPKMGIGQGEVHMNVTTNSIWIESLVSGPQCFDASAYTHLHLDITSRDNFSVDIQLEEGAPGSCDAKGRVVKTAVVNSAKYTTFNRLARRAIVVPLADFPGLNFKNLRGIQLKNFKNPSNQWVYMDNVAFIGGAHRKPSGANPHNSIAGKDTFQFACTDPSTYASAGALKFHAIPSAADVSFTVKVGYASDDACKSAEQFKTFESKSFTTFPLDEVPLGYEFVIPLSDLAKTKQRITSMKIVDVQPADAKIDINRVRIGSEACEEPINPLHPNWSPKPWPAGFEGKIYEVFPNPAGKQWVDPPVQQNDVDAEDPPEQQVNDEAAPPVVKMGGNADAKGSTSDPNAAGRALGAGVIALSMVASVIGSLTACV
ncbi:hypothetical protein BCR44DRAFT_242071 [Catenaria anguillulae PL171]|uniref:WW domain-containing protein n=1 Tax=Catenaria anguillulae PL171 TaxID=765915 RepID=A0A1Y2H9M2_9FUNG|nr:hypothetical protein BCR44DRAFT_242071 [Catenaria anguillulae PL171]